MPYRAQEVGAGCFQRGLAFPEPFWREVYLVRDNNQMQKEQVVPKIIGVRDKRHKCIKHP
jgi:hypothetical protein